MKRLTASDRRKNKHKKSEKYPPKERRKYPRVFMNLPFEYWTQDNPHVRSGGIVLDASETGFRIHSIQTMAVGTQLKITVFYIFGYRLETFEVFAEIVWEDAPRNTKYLYGTKIIEAAEKHHNILKSILRHNSVKSPIHAPRESKSGDERSMTYR